MPRSIGRRRFKSFLVGDGVADRRAATAPVCGKREMPEKRVLGTTGSRLTRTA